MTNASTSAQRRFAITNLAKRPLVLSLNSKDSLHLAPGARAAGLAEQEVIDNPDIKKLERLSLIQCVAADDTPRERGKMDAEAKPGRAAREK